MTTLREATAARARADGFREASDLIQTLSEAGLSPLAIRSAMTAQSVELIDVAIKAEREARAVIDANAEARKTPPTGKKKAAKAETLPLVEAEGSA